MKTAEKYTTIETDGCTPTSLYRMAAVDNGNRNKILDRILVIDEGALGNEYVNDTIIRCHAQSGMNKIDNYSFQKVKGKITKNQGSSIQSQVLGNDKFGEPITGLHRKNRLNLGDYRTCVFPRYQEVSGKPAGITNKEHDSKIKEALKNLEEEILRTSVI